MLNYRLEGFLPIDIVAAIGLFQASGEEQQSRAGGGGIWAEYCATHVF